MEPKLSQPVISDWANWLNSIAQNPHQHEDLIQVENKIYYSTRPERERMQKEGYFVRLLTIKKIIEVTQEMWSESTVSEGQKREIVEGMEYMHAQRRAKYKTLFWPIKWFARLRGVALELKAEEKAIKQLRKEIEGIQASTFCESKEEKKLDFQWDVLRQKGRDLGRQKNTLRGKDKETWYEDFFQYEIEWEQLIHLAKDKVSTTESLQKLEVMDEELKKNLDEWNEEMPRFSQIVKRFSKQTLPSTLKATLKVLCAKKKLTQAEKKRDQTLFQCSSFEVQGLYIKRYLKAKQTGLSLSLVTAIERTWKEVKTQQEATTKVLEGLRVIFNPPDKEIFIKEAYISEGSYKAAFVATSYFALKTQADRCSLTILQPIKFVEEEIEEEQQKNQASAMEIEESSPISSSDEGEEIPAAKVCSDQNANEIFAQTTVIHQNEAQTSDLMKVEKKDKATQATGTVCIDREEFEKGKAQLSLEEEQENPLLKSQEVKADQPDSDQAEEIDYQKEAQNCLEYGYLPKIWPTHKILSVDGHIAIIQPRAGYSMTTTLGENVTAISFADMSILLGKKQLSTQHQLVLLEMIGNFLTGVETLHRLGVMHRDLKPANILCSPEGKAAVSDLGTLCKDKILVPNVSSSGEAEWIADPAKDELIGTPYYIAPEMVIYTGQGKGAALDLAVDIWGVGLILWKLLSGEELWAHPAFNITQITPRLTPITAVMRIGNLLYRKEAYQALYQESLDKTSMAHLVWSCTRAEPSQRPCIEEVCKRYQAWSQQTTHSIRAGKISFLHDNFHEANV